MILAPSDIHFLQDISTTGLLEPDEATMAELLNRFLQGQERIPKVQVAEKNGAWFALNNSYLHIIRDLERKGKCARILVEIVPLTKVPKMLQKGMVVNCDHSSRDRTCCGEGRVPCEGGCGKVATDEEDSSSYGSSDYSDCDEDDEDLSDSEYEDELSCGVCGSGFATARLLSQHQRRKRHFGCGVCDATFPSLVALEGHKESLDHWSEDDDDYGDASDDDGRDCDATATKVAAVKKEEADGEKAEEMERLL